MALPAGTLSSCTLCVELSTDGTTWTDFSDYMTVVEPPDMSRMSGEAYVLGEDIAVLGGGKREPVEVQLRSVYVDSTATTNPFSYVWAEFTADCGDAVHVRWAPAGCATTNQVFSTATATGMPAEMITLTLPGGDASDGSPILWGAVIKAPTIYRATYA
jgi:hypothetical protein